MIKFLFFCLNLLILSHKVSAQVGYNNISTNKDKNGSTSVIINSANMPGFHVGCNKTTHIISPEPILYVDISSPNVEGDLPQKNLFRFKPSVNCKPGDQFQVTVVTEQFVIAYKMTLSNNDSREATVITIDPNQAVPTNSSGQIGKTEFDRLSLFALTKKSNISNIKSKANGIEMTVNNIYIVGDFLLFDVGVKNNTKLQYDLDQVRFKITDKKQVGAHVSQELEVDPVYEFYKTDNTVVNTRWRNFYLFRKFTYPREKVFHIELNEKQVSGRNVEVNINYKQVLHADYLL